MEEEEEEEEEEAEAAAEEAHQRGGRAATCLGCRPASRRGSLTFRPLPLGPAHPRCTFLPRARPRAGPLEGRQTPECETCSTAQTQPSGALQVPWRSSLPRASRASLLLRQTFIRHLPTPLTPGPSGASASHQPLLLLALVPPMPMSSIQEACL
jgi:hypothetical protein